jgi:hypothetical protein
VDLLFTTVVLPAVNKIFADGLPLPSLDGLTLTDTALLWGDGFFTLATDFTFNVTASGMLQAAAQHGAIVPAGAWE